jgi:hypothetical protein
MGLLDYHPDPIGQGLLGLGTALMRPRAMGGGMAAGLEAFNQNALQANQLKRQAQQDALREQLLQAQMGEFKAQAEQRQAQAEAQRAAMAQRQAQAEAQRSVLSQFAAPPMGFRDASIAMGGAAPAGYSPPQAGAASITPAMAAQYLAAGGNLDDLRKVVEAKDFGRAEVAGTIETTGQDGRPVNRMRDKFGGFIGDALPKAYEKKFQDTGGALGVFDPYTAQQTGSVGKTMTPGEMASNAVARGNLGVSQARLAFDKSQAGGGGGFEYRQTPEGLIVVPKVPTADGPVQSRPVLNATGAPVGGAGGTSAQQRTTDATDALQIIEDARKVVGSATGSFFGAGYDVAARAFGNSPKGAQGAAQLQALEGILVSKMPKMSGPQSDKDVALYRQMAGQIGDPTIPAGTKKAALDMIEQIQRRYAGLPSKAAPDAAPSPAPAASVPSGQAFSDMPPAPQYRGKSITDTVTGKTYKSNGFSWVEQ